MDQHRLAYLEIGVKVLYEPVQPAHMNKFFVLEIYRSGVDSIVRRRVVTRKPLGVGIFESRTDVRGTGGRQHSSGESRDTGEVRNCEATAAVVKVACRCCRRLVMLEEKGHENLGVRGVIGVKVED